MGRFKIMDGTTTTGYDAVCMVTDQADSFACTGTLIDSRHVLTAGHCGQKWSGHTDPKIIFGPTFWSPLAIYQGERVYQHPGYRGERNLTYDSSNDMCIVRLSADVTEVAPVGIYRSTPTVGQILTLVGFGGVGSGATGSDGSAGVKYVGTTPIEGVSSTIITWIFDPGESSIAPGDSGGPAFIGGQVAGVTSAGEITGGPPAQWGDQAWDTRVDPYAEWIDNIIAAGTDTGEDGPQPDSKQTVGVTVGSNSTTDASIRPTTTVHREHRDIPSGRYQGEYDLAVAATANLTYDPFA